MDYDCLSENGLQKVINNAPAIIQILDVQLKVKGENQFKVVSISDGFAQLKKCCVTEGGEKLKVFDVIRTEEVSASFKDGRPMVLIERFTLVRDDITAQIGSPINYSEWQQTKKNPNGDNTLPPRKGKNNGKPQFQPQPPQIKQPPNLNNNSNTAAQSKQAVNQGAPKANFQAPQIPRFSGNNSNSNATNVQAKNQQPLNNKPLQKPQIKPQIKPPLQNQSNQQKISSVPQNQNNKNPPPQTKPQTERYDRSYNLIKELYEGIQDWKIKVRVLFSTEVKTFIKKTNGQESQLFSFEASDYEDCVEISVFGDTAPTFKNAIELDQIYEISGGKVGRDDKKNRIKIILNERSIINRMDEDSKIRTLEDVCISPEKLLQMDTGAQCCVIGLVKDVNPVVEFVSKNQKQCRKKQIYLCDPEMQVEVPITLWFDNADITYEKTPYAFQGITVGQFKDQKQFGSSQKFSCRPYRNHRYKKFLGTFEKTKYENPIFESSNKSRPNIEMFNFHIFKQEAERLDNFNSLTIEKLCYLTGVPTANKKGFYLSCPHCKKKVLDEENGVCTNEKCGKAYGKGQYRYLLNVALTDEVDTVWATAYDEAAEVLLTSEADNKPLTANQFVNLTEDDFKSILPQFYDREIKAVITAKKETYNGQEKIKYSVGKVTLHIDYQQESVVLSKQIELLKGSM